MTLYWNVCTYSTVFNLNMNIVFLRTVHHNNTVYEATSLFQWKYGSPNYCVSCLYPVLHSTLISVRYARTWWSLEIKFGELSLWQIVQTWLLQQPLGRCFRSFHRFCHAVFTAEVLCAADITHYSVGCNIRGTNHCFAAQTACRLP
jgi:hypothetical protein